MIDIFYGRDIPKLFPKPQYWAEMNNIESDGVYTINEFNYQNNTISFKKCRWLKLE